MKRKATLLSLLILAVVLCLFACDSDVTDIVAKEDNFAISVGATVDISDLVEVTGKGNIDFFIEPADIVSVNGDKLTGLKEGTCTITVYSGDILCRVNLTVANGKKITAGIKNETFTYDGGVHTLTVEGTYPKSAEIKLLCDGEVFSGAKEPGEYAIELEVKAPEGYVVEYADKRAVLKIDKIYADMSAVRFDPQTYVYDGTEKNLVVSGSLPAGVAVSYRNNSAVDVGSYLAEAIFSVDERYYHAIEPVRAKLVILKCDLSGEIDVTDFRVTYDEADHFPAWNLPAGVTAEYYVYDNSTLKYIPKNTYYTTYAAKRPFVNSGTYRIKTTFALDEALKKNYKITEEKESIVTIDKAGFDYDLRYSQTAFVYDGSAKVVGLGNAYDVGLIGEMPKDIYGNVVDGVTVEFYYGTTHGSTLSFFDAGKYFVRAKFNVPDEYKPNYDLIDDMVCSVVISKATYPSSFAFTAVELYGDGLDFSTPHEYDGNTHYFALRFPTDGDKVAFTEDITIKYYYRKDGDDKVESDDDVGIKYCGNYVVGYTLSFVDPEMKKNYNLPADGSFGTAINKVVFNMRNVTFDDLTVTYDGAEHTPVVTGLPEGVRANVTNGGKINSGVYTVTAVFEAESVPYGNYTLRGLDGELTSLTSRLTINKADYQRADVPDFYTEGTTYSPDGQLSDVPILLAGEPGQNVRWVNGSDKPVCNISAYDVIYDPDPINHNGFRYKLPLSVSPLVLSADKFALSDQFVPHNGGKARPIVIYDGTAISGVSLDYACETEDPETKELALGKHILTDIVLVLDDDVNYRFDDEVTFDALTVYIYNASLFRYNGLVLEKYIGGEVEVAVPEGTVTIANSAFANCFVSKLTVPETVTSMSNHALANMQYLRELVVPYIGTTEGSGTLASVFGGELPATLTKVTATDIDEIRDNAFNGASSLTEVVFTEDILSVGQYAFDGCSSLTALSFEKITYLGNSAFHGCFGLTSLSVPFMGQTGQDGTIAYLFGTDSGDNAFSNYALNELDLGSGTFTSLPTEAFKGMVSIRVLDLPSTLNAVAYKTFAGLYAPVVLNDNFTSVRNGAFYDYKGTSVTLPDNLTRIEEYAFADATNISSLTLPAGVDYIGQYAFRNVRGTVGFTGAALTRIEDRAFAGYKGNGFVLPSSVTAIGDGAFAGSGISSVAITSDVTLDGEGIFKDCVSLTVASVDAGEIPYATFEGCSALYSLTLAGTTAIGNRAFYGCSALPNVGIPSAVETVGSNAFNGCTALSFMRFNGPAPTFGDNALPSGTALEIRVPVEYKAGYLFLQDDYDNVTVI